MQTLKTIAEVIGYIASLSTAVMWIVRPIRDKVFGLEAKDEGTRCLLRSEIVRTYYKHLPDEAWKEYEFRNTEACYKAYKALGGNSFVSHIYEEMCGWKVVQ